MGLTLQFVPFNEIAGLGSARRVTKLINIVKENKIVLLEGRLKKEEEADLISIAMEEINNRFKGIELAVIDPEKGKARCFWWNEIRHSQLSLRRQTRIHSYWSCNNNQRNKERS